MSDIAYRPARPEDAEAVARLHHVTREVSMPYLPILYTLDEGIAFFSTVIDRRAVLVAHVDSDIVGYCAYGDGWLEHLYVHPDYLGRGIGSELLTRAIARFYERFGFRFVRQTDRAENIVNERGPGSR